MVTRFEELYKDGLETQKARYEKLKASYSAFFKDSGEVEYFSAPGRSEIGGNHTDHQRGRVVAAAVNLDIIAAARKRSDNTIVLKSEEYVKYDTIDITELSPVPEEKERSAAVIRGICARCRELGYQIGGFNAYTISSVLKGSGLSSSAAFEILVVTIISHFYNDGKIDPVTAAQIAQYAENVYFGKPSGLLDQSASSVGGFTAIDFKDPKKPQFEKISLELKDYGYNLCVVDTGGNHADLTCEYAAVPADMKKVAEYFGKEVLRDVDENEFMAEIHNLRSKLGDRPVLRAMHFFSDNKIAAEEAEALKSGDFDRFKRLVMESGRSSFMYLQNVFACSAPEEQGLTLALAVTERVLGGKGAYRVHGGGFAGTIQAYVPDELLEVYRSEIEKVFGAGSCYVLSVRGAGGTKVEL